jgi:hypothetical protein
MTTKQQIAIAEAIIQTGLVSKVFHSCELLKTDDGQTIYPAYKIGREFTYSGIDDAKGLFAYIRSNGDTVGVPIKIDSCGKSYTMTAPLRVVFFNDNESRDFNELTTLLSSFTFMGNVNLVRVVTDKFRLVREESPMFREKFDGQTFYVAFDVSVTFVLLKSDCEPNVCQIFINPVTTCPAAVQKSTESATS